MSRWVGEASATLPNIKFSPDGHRDILVSGSHVSCLIQWKCDILVRKKKIHDMGIIWHLCFLCTDIHVKFLFSFFSFWSKCQQFGNKTLEILPFPAIFAFLALNGFIQAVFLQKTLSGCRKKLNMFIRYVFPRLICEKRLFLFKATLYISHLKNVNF